MPCISPIFQAFYCVVMKRAITPVPAAPYGALLSRPAVKPPWLRRLGRLRHEALPGFAGVLPACRAVLVSLLSETRMNYREARATPSPHSTPHPAPPRLVSAGLAGEPMQSSISCMRGQAGEPPEGAHTRLPAGKHEQSLQNGFSYCSSIILPVHFR